MGKTTRKISACLECSRVTEHHAHGLCQSCYDKQQYTNHLRKPNSPKCKEIMRRNWCSAKEHFLKNFMTLEPTSKRISVDGYYMIRFAGYYIGEHRWIMMKKMNRPLFSWETVHHLNRNKLDNRPENLSLLPNGQHRCVTQLIKDFQKLYMENMMLKTIVFKNYKAEV